MKTKMGLLAVSAVTVFALAACGGGGGKDGSGSDTSGSSGSGNTSTTPSNGAGSTASTLTATQYALYKYGTQSQLTSAGSVSSPTSDSGTLALDSGNTVLTLTDASSGAMSASGYYITNRSNGAVVMLCDPLQSGGTVGTNTKSRYVAVATSASDGNQGTPVNNIANLAGKTLYYVEDCSFQNKTGNAEGQNNAPDTNTASLVVDSSGNITFNNGTSPISSSQATSILSGTANPVSGGNVYWNAYQLKNGQYVIVERGVPSSSTTQGYVGMWIAN